MARVGELELPITATSRAEEHAPSARASAGSSLSDRRRPAVRASAVAPALARLLLGEEVQGLPVRIGHDWTELRAHDLDRCPLCRRRLTALGRLGRLMLH